MEEFLPLISWPKIQLFGQELTLNSTIVTMWGIMAIILIVFIVGARNPKMRPHGLQNALEKIIEMLMNFVSGIMGPKRARQYFPLLATLFIVILLSNYSGLLPLSGHLPGLKAPSSSLGVTAGLAIVVFFATHILGIKTHGLKYFKTFLQPVAPLLPLMILEAFIRPLSLSLRLYGNIYGEESVTAQFFGLVPLLVPIVMQALSLLMGFVQAMVFTLLSCIYISEATESEEEEEEALESKPVA